MSLNIPESYRNPFKVGDMVTYEITEGCRNYFKPNKPYKVSRIVESSTKEPHLVLLAIDIDDRAGMVERYAHRFRFYKPTFINFLASKGYVSTKGYSILTG